MSDELLFNKYQIFGVVQGQTEAVKKRVKEVPANTLLNASEHDLAQTLIEEFRLNVPVIREDDIAIAHSGETQVDVSRDPMRMIYNRSQSFTCRAIRRSSPCLSTVMRSSSEFSPSPTR